MSALAKRFGEIRRYPSAIVGLILILALFVVSIYTLIAIPYDRAIHLWRGGETVWGDNPRNAGPAWFNIFPGVNLPTTMVLDSGQMPETKSSEDLDGIKEVRIELPVEFTFDGFPKELNLNFNATTSGADAFVTVYWLTPDGRQIRLAEQSVKSRDTIRISQLTRVQRQLGNMPPEIGLFAEPGTSADPRPLKGTYRLVVDALMFESTDDIDARFVVYGQLHGWAGTDHRRRDITVALLWGAPIALAFGLMAAVGSTASTMVIAAIGVWWGRWVDALIQRITEVNLILPVLPILIMVGTMYSRSIWVILSIVILLGIFSGSIKTYRAIFLQVKESSYIDAARAYGASSFRIIFRYMIPRIAPILVPQFVVLIPSYVFLEATLSVLGLGDPILPTWGKVLDDAYTNGALYRGYYYWVLSPSVLLVATGLGFSMLGFALDRIFNPRLRGL